MDVEIEKIKERKNHTYADIFLFNSYKNSKKFDDALECLSFNYEKLFEVGITLSAFQFVGIVLEANIKSELLYIQVGYFVLCVGFIISLFGTLLSYISFTYINSIKGESDEFILNGIQKYKHFFKISDIILYVDSILFVIPINLLIHNVLDMYYSIIFNVLCGLLFITGVSVHYYIITRVQNYGRYQRKIKM